jgi:hypothetical protein
VTDGIERVTARGLVTRDGVERPVDAIVCGTGFSAADYLAPIHIVGRDGVTLNDSLQQRREHYLGIDVGGFPNLHLLMGPNTGLGHNSMIFMIEAQARYAMQAIRALRSAGSETAALDVRPEVQRSYVEEIQEKLRRTVWSSGCASWYLKDGYNATLWPGFTFQYWWRALRFDLAKYAVLDPATAESIPASRGAAGALPLEVPPRVDVRAGPPNLVA